MTALPLVFDAPRRGMPPRHLADLTRGRGAARPSPSSASRAFRADQLARHYFRRLADRPGADDRPARGGPRALAARCCRRLLTAVRHRPADDGQHPQDAVAAARRRARRERAHALPRPGHRLRLQPGRLRDGLPVLRHRPGRPDPQPVHRGDRRARWSPAPRPLARRRGRRRPGPAVQRRVHGHGRAAGQLRPRRGRRRAGSPPRPRTAWASPQRAVTVSTVGLVPGHRQLTEEGLQRHARRVACTPPTTSCATRSCRSTRGGRSARCSPRPTPTPTPPAAGSPSSTR